MYTIILTPDDNGTILVTCTDLPELATFGEDVEDALHRAADAIEEALAARIARREEIPASSAGLGERNSARLPPLTVAKVELYRAVHAQGCQRQNWRAARARAGRRSTGFSNSIAARRSSTSIGRRARSANISRSASETWRDDGAVLSRNGVGKNTTLWASVFRADRRSIPSPYLRPAGRVTLPDPPMRPGQRCQLIDVVDTAYILRGRNQKRPQSLFERLLDMKGSGQSRQGHRHPPRKSIPAPRPRLQRPLSTRPSDSGRIRHPGRHKTPVSCCERSVPQRLIHNAMLSATVIKR